MKKLLTLLIALAFLFQSCGNQKEEKVTETPKHTTKIAEKDSIDKHTETNKQILATSNEIQIPKDYSELKESPANGKKMSRLLFDFDNDSEKDIATIIEHKSDFSKYKLLIYLTTSKRQYEIDLLNKYSDFNIYPVQLKVSKKVLQFGYFEDGTSAFGRFIKLRYNPEFEKIQVIGYDTGYRLPTGHIDKSYNLLTGKYTVKRNYYDVETKKENTVEFSGQNDYFKKKVFIEDLSIEMIFNLDDIGSKYE